MGREWGALENLPPSPTPPPPPGRCTVVTWFSPPSAGVMRGPTRRHKWVFKGLEKICLVITRTTPLEASGSEKYDTNTDDTDYPIWALPTSGPTSSGQPVSLGACYVAGDRCPFFFLSLAFISQSYGAKGQCEHKKKQSRLTELKTNPAGVSSEQFRLPSALKSPLPPQSLKNLLINLSLRNVQKAWKNNNKEK